MSTIVRDTRVAAHAVRATLAPEAMQAAAGRIGLTIAAGNEGGGVVVAAGASDAARPPRQSRRHAGRRHVCAVPLHRRPALPGPPGRDRPGGRRLVFRESPHGAGHGRDHADGGPHRAGAHRRGVESRTHAAKDLHGGRHPAGQHRAHARAGGVAAPHRGHARLRYQSTHVYRGSHQRAGGYRCHVGL